jgi:hypothetical protein
LLPAALLEIYNAEIVFGIANKKLRETIPAKRSDTKIANRATDNFIRLSRIETAGVPYRAKARVSARLS